MGLPDIGKNADGGLYDLLQRIHLARLRDASFEESNVVACRHLPYGQRHPNLRVVALGAGDDAAVGAQQLHQPVFDNRLAVTASDANHGDMILPTVYCGDALQGVDNIVNPPQVGVGEGHIGTCGENEGTHTGTVQFIDIAHPTIALGGDGEKKGPLGSAQTATVGKQVHHFALWRHHLTVARSDDTVNLLYLHLFTFSSRYDSPCDTQGNDDGSSSCL